MGGPAGLLNRIVTTQAEPPTILAFGADRVADDSPAKPPSEMRPTLDYFEVTVNEMFLSYKRKWFKTFDPLVYTVVEFQYGTELRHVPFIIGPQLVQGAGTQKVPEAQGIVFTDTKVAGLYPLKGETLALTVMLCRLEQQDYLRNALRTIEKVSTAIDVGALLAPYIKIVDVVAGALDDILDSSGTQLLAGFRRELRPPVGIPSPSYLALIGRTNVPADGLWVRNGRLVKGDSPASAQPYRDDDFVLVSVSARDKRHDTDLLPFYPLWQQVQREAERAINEELWQERAKGALYTLAEALYDSPDLTAGQCDALIEEYEARAVILRDEARRRKKLGPAERELIDSRPLSTRILGL